LKKIVILFSGEGSNLENLIRTLHPHKVEVVAAITNKPEAKGILRAKNLGVETIVILSSTIQNIRQEKHSIPKSLKRLKIWTWIWQFWLVLCVFSHRFLPTISKRSTSTLPFYRFLKAQMHWKEALIPI